MQRVHHQHRDRERPDTAGHRRQGACHFRDGGMDIANEHRPFGLERCKPRMTCRKQLRCHRGIRHAIHSDVDYGRARLHEVVRDEAGSPDSCDEDIRLAADGR